jgi:hypothetical protein
MNESVIRHFFEGHATAAELAADTAGAFDRRTDSAGTVFSKLHATPMDREFDVTPDHIVALIDAVLDGVIELEALDAIAFCLEASDRFMWDTDTEGGDRVARALFLLGAPEVNFPLTVVVLRKIRHLLQTGEETFDAADHRPPGPRPHLLTEKSWHREPDV